MKMPLAAESFVAGKRFQEEAGRRIPCALGLGAYRRAKPNRRYFFRHARGGKTTALR
jgi:hypothetical protein